MVVGGNSPTRRPPMYSMVVGGNRQHGAFGVHLEYPLSNNSPITCSERIFIFFRLRKPVLRVFIAPVINYHLFSI